MRGRGVVVWFAMLAFAMGITTIAGGGSPVTDVTVAKAQALIRERAGAPDFAILDVRTPGEFAEGHVAGAVNMDVQAPDFEARLRPLDRAKTYLVYCRTGNRSRGAIQAMERLGFRSVFHMTEGVVGWQRQKLPLSRSS
jgi:rhodanese-related sulfurtransferase